MMKKNLILLGLLLLPAIVFAQGTVQFANISTALMTTNGASIGGGSGVTTGTQTYRVGLYVAPQGSINPAAFTLVGLATNGTVPVSNGRFNGGNPFVIAGNNGVIVAFQIRAWQLSAGNTYEEAIGINVYRGVSGIGEVTPATGTQTTPALFGAGAGQLSSGFILVPNIPEPSSIALGILGLGAVALFRRKK